MQLNIIEIRDPATLFRAPLDGESLDEYSHLFVRSLSPAAKTKQDISYLHYLSLKAYANHTEKKINAQLNAVAVTALTLIAGFFVGKRYL